MKKNMFIIAALLAAAGSLQAASVTYTNTVAMTNAQNAVVTLTKFDTTLGTLTGVYLEYITQISGAIVQMDNDSAVAQWGAAYVQNNVSTFSSSASLTGTGIVKNDMALYEENIFDLAATTGDSTAQFDITAGADYAIWSPGMLTGIGSGYVDAGVFSDYEGVGTFTATIKSIYTTGAYFEGQDGRINLNTPNGAFSGKVIYEYTPIPEPATASMLALAGLVAFLFRRHLTK